MSIVRFTYSWRKMEAAAQDRSGWRLALQDLYVPQGKSYEFLSHCFKEIHFNIVWTLILYVIIFFYKITSYNFVNTILIQLNIMQ